MYMHKRFDTMIVFIGSLAILTLIFSGVFLNMRFVSDEKRRYAK